MNFNFKAEFRLEYTKPQQQLVGYSFLSGQLRMLSSQMSRSGFSLPKLRQSTLSDDSLKNIDPLTLQRFPKCINMLDIPLPHISYQANLRFSPTFWTFFMRCKPPPDSSLDTMEYCFIRDAMYRMGQGDRLCLRFVLWSNLCRGCLYFLVRGTRGHLISHTSCSYSILLYILK